MGFAPLFKPKCIPVHVSALENLVIRRFRMFPELDFGPFQDVNLFFGPNNSGKTAALEAVVRLGEPHPQQWRFGSQLRASSLNQRGRLNEVDAVASQFNRPRLEPAAFGRQFDGQMELRGSSGEFVTASYDARTVAVPPAMLTRRANEQMSSGDPNEPVPVRVLLLRIESHEGPFDEVFADLPLGQYASVEIERHFAEAFGRSSSESRNKFRVSHRKDGTQVVGASGLTHDEAGMWTSLDRDYKSDLARKLMHEFDPRIQDIRVFSDRGKAHLWALVDDSWLPSEALGQGLRRALEMAGCLVRARGTRLVIDELELGLHAWVTPKVATWLVRAARDLRVQLFISTHSLDVIDGILKASKDTGTGLTAFRMRDAAAPKLQPEVMSGTRLHELRHELGREVRA